MLDLARVLESEPGGHVVTGWSLLPPSRRHPQWRLLLHVSFERPVLCDFTVGFDVRDHPSDPLRATLPLLLAPTASSSRWTDGSTLNAHSSGSQRRSYANPVLELLTAVGL